MIGIQGKRLKIDITLYPGEGGDLSKSPTMLERPYSSYPDPPLYLQVNKL